MTRISVGALLLALGLGPALGCKSKESAPAETPSAARERAPAQAARAASDPDDDDPYDDVDDVDDVDDTVDENDAIDDDRPHVTDTLETSAGPVTITPIYHATVAFGFQGKTIVVDPWSEAPGGSLPKADLVLLTDVHPDHLDADGLAAVRKPGTVVVAPAAVAKTVTDAKVLANGEDTEVMGVKIHAVPMYNLKRGPKPGELFHTKGRGNGYVLTIGGKRIYLSGDTECTPEMRALKNIDVAFVCMNLPYTMPVDEAAECIKAFKPRVVIPYHYRGQDPDRLEAALRGQTSIQVRDRDFYPDADGD